MLHRSLEITPPIVTHNTRDVITAELSSRVAGLLTASTRGKHLEGHYIYRLPYHRPDQ